VLRVIDRAARTLEEQLPAAGTPRSRDDIARCIAAAVADVNHRHGELDLASLSSIHLREAGPPG